MNTVSIAKSEELCLEELTLKKVEISSMDYELRVKLLLEKMQECNLDYVIIYGDREHFSNIEYFTSYDCRFEEGLFILDKKGNKYIIFGNEGYSASFKIPYEINRFLYQNFSLQGQPKNKLVPLSSILAQCGIARNVKAGLVGYKYMENDMEGSPDKTYDIPAYILDAIKEAAGVDNLINFTRAITGFGSIRLTIRSAREIAWAEYAAAQTTNALIRMLKGLRAGISEQELSELSRPGYNEQNLFPSVNFGSDNVFIGLRSPGNKKLEVGEVALLSYSIRGSLAARAGVAAYDEKSYADALGGSIENFYKPYWLALAGWYEALHIGAEAGTVYDAVMNVIGGDEFGVGLNPGHYTGTDEWVNSPFQKGSKVIIEDGSHFQADMIASKKDPVMCAICEDTLIVAGERLRTELRNDYPEVAERIKKRQDFMRNILGINLSDDVLPLSNLSGVYHPFMLNLEYIFSK